MNFWFGLSWVILFGVAGLFAADLSGVWPLTEGNGARRLLVPMAMALALIAGGFIARKSARRVWSGQIMVVVFGIAVSGMSWTYRATLTPEALKSSVNEIVALLTSQTPAGPHPAPAEAVGRGLVSVERGAGGHFWVQAAVNGTSVRFLVDTGATYTALTRPDAQRLGFNLKALEFSQTAQTPNGPVDIAAVSLEELRIGGLKVQNLQAVVLKSDLSNSLLGMNFLQLLKQFEIRGDTLLMRQ